MPSKQSVPSAGNLADTLSGGWLAIGMVAALTFAEKPRS
jgi:hypothetical protein